MNRRKATEIRVDFSLKREVFFVVIGAILGAVSMLIPTAFEVGMGIPYYGTWVAFGHVVGVYSSEAAFCRNCNSYNNFYFNRRCHWNFSLQNWNTYHK